MPTAGSWALSRPRPARGLAQALPRDQVLGERDGVRTWTAACPGLPQSDQTSASTGVRSQRPRRERSHFPRQHTGGRRAAFALLTRKQCRGAVTGPGWLRPVPWASRGRLRKPEGPLVLHVWTLGRGNAAVGYRSSETCSGTRWPLAGGRLDSR